MLMVLSNFNFLKIMKRQSNIELLRCLSMFMVLLLHSSFLAFGMPDSEAVQSNPWLWGAG